MISEIEKSLPWVTEGVTVELEVDNRLLRFCDAVRLTHNGWRWDRAEDGETTTGAHEPVVLRVGTKAIVRGYRIIKADGVVIHKAEFDPYFYAEQGDKVTILPSMTVKVQHG